MSDNSNILIGIFVIIILVAVVYYLNQNNQQPVEKFTAGFSDPGFYDEPLFIPNYARGAITNFVDNQFGNQTTTDARNLIDKQTGLSKVTRPVRPPILENRRADEISGDLVSNIVSQYSIENRPIEGGTGSFLASDPMSDTHGPFTNYGHKKQLNMLKMEEPYSDDMYDARDYSYRPHRMRNVAGKQMKMSPEHRRDDAAYRKEQKKLQASVKQAQRKLRDFEDSVEASTSSEAEAESDHSKDFTYKKRPYVKRTPEDVKNQFDSAAMLPNEIEDDWFDVEPLLTTKKVAGTYLIHPKVHMGVNTVGSTLRNGSHDLRGDIPNPKINVSPWNNSTIEPDTNIKGICTSI